MSDKVKIELRPYDAIAILSFLREFINDENKNDSRLAAIHETVKEYEDEIHKNMTSDMLEDAILENSINGLAGRHPVKR